MYPRQSVAGRAVRHDIELAVRSDLQIVDAAAQRAHVNPSIVAVAPGNANPQVSVTAGQAPFLRAKRAVRAELWAARDQA